MDQKNCLLSSYEQIMKVMNSSQFSSIAQQDGLECRHTQRQCRHCSRLGSVLQEVEQKYAKLIGENYAGELTISYLRRRNIQLIRQLSNYKVQERYTNSGDKKQRRISEAQTVQNEQQYFMQTFNPSQLRNMISQSCNTNFITHTVNQQGQNKQNRKDGQMSFEMDQNNDVKTQSKIQSTRPSFSINANRKVFSLSDLKQKAQLRLKKINTLGDGIARNPQLEQNQSRQFRIY